MLIILNSRISGESPVTSHLRLAARPMARMGIPSPHRPQLESSKAGARPQSSTRVAPPRSRPCAFAMQPLSAIATLLTPYSTPTTDHTALSSPSKSQKSIYMRSLVVPIYISSCSSQQDVRQNTYQNRHRIIPGSRPAACTYKCDLPNSATLMC